MLPVAVIAGGRGTRIAGIAKGLPKALVPVAGRPFIDHQLAWLARGGVTDVIFCIGYGGKAIKSYVGSGARWRLNVIYSEDGEVLRGTGGAVLRALPFLGGAFLTVYGDALLQCPPHRVADALSENSDAVMTVFENRDRWLKSNVDINGELVVAYNKEAPQGTMMYIDYGLNAFQARAFDGFSADRPFDLAEVHLAAISRGSLRALRCDDRWFEIGSPEGLAETERFILTQSA